MILEYHGEGHFQNDLARTNDIIKKSIAKKINIGYYELSYDNEEYSDLDSTGKEDFLAKIILDRI